ncbi:sensor histidine kinase [Priestia megaterium]|uniref:sensor histidine kinase n=1 Tax=Priestia megaterium TaxID=1404 RepID=UPI002E1CD44B|nr:sensor histidine kinase [Priestia megaterium]
MDQELVFKASTNIKNLIGRDLVTDQFTAIFELVKNSYDADAKEVRLEFAYSDNGDMSLIIEDNGIGMSLEDIKDKWMVIGTDSKKHVLYSEKLGRPLNGDKGIGRFSVDRLGDYLKLESVKEEAPQKVEMEFNWRDFEDEFGNLDDIKIPYFISLHPNKPSGVRLEISKLRDSWDRKSIEKLISNLQQFKSPFSINDNFKIILHAPEFQIYSYEITPFNLEEISSLWVDVEIPIENTSIIKANVVRDGIRYTEDFTNPFNFGAVKSRVYFFNSSEKVRFKHKMHTTVKDFGNVRLYRDDFRIYPYGESFNDWLDLDIRKAQGYARFFGSRDLVGYVQIYKEHNKEINAPTNRQGLIENSYSRELRKFILDYPIKILEKYFFKKPKNETFLKAKEEVRDAVDELKKVTKEINKSSPETAKVLRKITGVVEKSQKEQSTYVKNQEELLEVYKRVASKEVLLHQIIHQALIKIEKVITVTYIGVNKINKHSSDEENLNDNLLTSFNNINKLTLNAKDYLKKARDHLIRKRRAEPTNLYNLTQSIIQTFLTTLDEERIELNIQIPAQLKFKIDKNDYETIIDNFFSNAIKSLKKSQGVKKEISIKIVESSSFITIVFKDNGIGIPLNLRDRIFDPFFSTTSSSGMGLSIVDEIVKENKGELNLAINDNVGAEFQIKFRK